MVELGRTDGLSLTGLTPAEQGNLRANPEAKPVLFQQLLDRPEDVRLRCQEEMIYAFTPYLRLSVSAWVQPPGLPVEEAYTVEIPFGEP